MPKGLIILTIRAICLALVAVLVADQDVRVAAMAIMLFIVAGDLRADAKD